MRVRRPGIALILVLVAAAAVFALAMQGAVASRLGAVETASSLRLHDGAMRARGAASLVFAGLLRTAADQEPIAGTGSDASPKQAPPSIAPDDLELPAFLRQMLEESGAELERAAADAAASQATTQALDGSGLGATAPKRVDLTQAIELILPTQLIDVEVDGWHCRVSLSDGAGGLNINTADEASLLRYVQAIGIEAPTDRAIVSQVIDWRDDDDFTGERGAERDTYERLGIVHRNAPMRSLAELLYLPAMTREILLRMEPDVCLSSDGRAHLGSASATVLAATGVLSADQISRIIALRDQGALTPGALEGIIDLDDESLAKRVRLETSPVLRVRVEAYPPGAKLGETGQALRYEGAAIVGERGLLELGLRADNARRAESDRPTITLGGNARS